MRQIFWSIWLENKQMPILVIFKVLFITLAIITGILLKGFTFGIFWFWISMLLQIFSIKPASQIEFLIPISDSDAKKFFLIKNICIAGIYTTANTLGYILMISFCAKYHWDGEMILLMFVMTVFSFYLFFYYRIVVDGNGYFEWKDRINFALPKKKNWWVVLEGIMPFLEIALIIAFLLYKLEAMKILLFLGRGQWRIFSLIVLTATFVLDSYTIWRRCKNLTMGEFFSVKE